MPVESASLRDRDRLFIAKAKAGDEWSFEFIVHLIGKPGSAELRSLLVDEDWWQERFKATSADWEYIRRVFNSREAGLSIELDGDVMTGRFEPYGWKYAIKIDRMKPYWPRDTATTIFNHLMVRRAREWPSIIAEQREADRKVEGHDRRRTVATPA